MQQAVDKQRVAFFNEKFPAGLLGCFGVAAGGRGRRGGGDAEIAGNGDGARHVVGVADDDDAVDFVFLDEQSGVDEVLVGVFGAGFVDDVVAGNALFDGEFSGDFAFAGVAFFARAAGEDEFFHALGLIQGDGVVDALAEHGRGFVAPCGGAKHHGGIGAFGQRGGGVGVLIDLPCAPCLQGENAEDAEEKAVAQIAQGGFLRHGGLNGPGGFSGCASWHRQPENRGWAGWRMMADAALAGFGN